MELEGEVSRKKDEIEDLENDINYPKSKITKIQLDIEGDSLLRRKTNIYGIK